MNKHMVFVAGKHFVLLSEDKSSYVKKIASEVNEAITKISLENPTLDRRGAAILCALDYADDTHKETLRNKSLSQKAQPLIAQADKQAKQLRELNKKLTPKDKEINNLKTELGSLRSDLEKTLHLLDNTKAKADSVSTVQPSPQKKPNTGFETMYYYSLFDYEEKN